MEESDLQGLSDRTDEKEKMVKNSYQIKSELSSTFFRTLDFALK